MCVGTVKINSLSRGFRYSGVRYSGDCFHIFYCNSAGLSNVVRYNGVFIIAGFVIAGCHCNLARQSAQSPVGMMTWDYSSYLITLH